LKLFGKSEIEVLLVPLHSARRSLPWVSLRNEVSQDIASGEPEIGFGHGKHRSTSKQASPAVDECPRPRESKGALRTGSK